MTKRAKLLKVCSEILEYDFARTVTANSGLYVCSIDIEILRTAALQTAPLLKRKKEVEKVSLFFNWLHEDRIRIEQEHMNKEQCIALGVH